MMVFMLVLLSLYLVVLLTFSAAASALAKSKAAAGFELVLYTKTGMGDGQQANNLGCKSFLILSQEYLGIIMLLFQMQMLALSMSNEIVANGGLTEVMLQLLQLMV
jgi:molybdopterin-containing oxidoreductase family iron-sulfur binding subunit